MLLFGEGLGLCRERLQFISHYTERERETSNNALIFTLAGRLGSLVSLKRVLTVLELEGPLTVRREHEALYHHTALSALI